MMKNGVVIVLLIVGAFLLTNKPNNDPPVAEAPDEEVIHAEATVVTDAEKATLETLKDNEASRVREMGTLAETYKVPLVPPYLNRPAPEELAQAMTAARGTTYGRLVRVATANQLKQALKNVQVGDFIYMTDGVYVGNFEATTSGRADSRITLYGSRNAIIDGDTVSAGYGLNLKADYWTLDGFTVRNAAKGIVLDQANHNVLTSVEVYQIGEEGIHFRRFSSDNAVMWSWVHDTGLTKPKFGEAIYIGTAVSNWGRYTDGNPDNSDRNQVHNNLLGPNVSAEAVDIKEGTSDGQVFHNTFITGETLVVNSWVDIKGNGYTVRDNVGMHSADGSFETAVEVNVAAKGWGEDNVFDNNTATAEYVTVGYEKSPFRAPFSQTGEVTIVLPARAMLYTLSELVARFPASFEHLDDTTVLLKEHLLVGQGAHMVMTPADAHMIRLLSNPERFVSIVGFRSDMTLAGTPQQELAFGSWDTTTNAPDTQIRDGRAYVFAYGGRMDVDYTSFSDFGFEEGIVSGVAWKGFGPDESVEVSRGNATNSRFLRNYFGAYTFQTVEMHWQGNLFADNLGYGFDPHDFSNDFVFEDNIAHDNGSHGIIFSRGCHGNIIRNNQSYNNHGHGIMLDDGKVLPDSNLVRYQNPVPSNNNLVENNQVWNNHDGIVLEGGNNNIVRNNEIHGTHRYGIRLKDAVSGTTVSNNIIEGNAIFGVYIYTHSDTNVFTDNTIIGGRGGIAIEDSAGNVLMNNHIQDISGAALIFNGLVTDSKVEHNDIAGRGTSPYRNHGAVGVTTSGLSENNSIISWRYPSPFSKIMSEAALALWIIVMAIPIIAKTVVFGRNRWRKVSRAIPFLHARQRIPTVKSNTAE